MRNEYKTLVGNSGRHKPHSVPKLILEDRIKIVLKEIVWELVNRIVLGHDRDL